MIPREAGRDHEPRQTRRLWSLWEMLRVFASTYVELGVRLEAAAQILNEANDITKSPWGRPLTNDEKDELVDLLSDMWKECVDLSLDVSAALLTERIVNPPSTARELDILRDAIKAELRTRLFLFVPQHLAKYHDLHTEDRIIDAFPSVGNEFRSAGNCIATGEFTAAVFHAMRAAEIGVRVLAKELEVSFPFELELAEWANLLDKIEAKIREMKLLPRNLEKDEKVQFYSEAASQFRYLKDGWRSRLAHGRATYGELQAQEIVDHTLSFFGTLARRFKE